MKKILLILCLGLSSIFVFAGCNNAEAAVEEPVVQEETVEEPETPVEDDDEDDTATYVGHEGNEIDAESGTMGGEKLDEENVDSEQSDSTQHIIDDAEPEIENPEAGSVTGKGTDKLTISNDEVGEIQLTVNVPVDVTTTHSTIKEDDIITFTWNENEDNARAYFRYNVIDGFNMNEKLMRCIESYIDNPDVATYHPKDDPEPISSDALYKLYNEEFEICYVYDSAEFGKVYLISSWHDCDPTNPECPPGLRCYAVCYDIRNNNGDCLKLCYEESAYNLCCDQNKIKMYTKEILGIE